MMRACFSHKSYLVLAAVGALFGFGSADTFGATIWNGPELTFTKQPGADFTLPANQDRLTANVWITRGDIRGLINAKTEVAYVNLSSPADTEWAFGELTNALSLSYTSWEQMYGGMSGGGPPGLLGKPTVMHLKTDDIYVAVKLLTWSQITGGGFSYVRSTPGGASTPTPPLLTDVTLAAGQSVRFRFTNAPGGAFTVVASSNLATPANNWTVLGAPTESPPGQYQFTDAGALTNASTRFYRVRSP